MDELQREKIVSAVLAEIQRQGMLSSPPTRPGSNGGGNGRPPQKLERIAVLGAGNGGYGIAAHMTLKGFQVNLFSFYTRELQPVRDKGGVELFGDVQGFARLNMVTESMEEAIRDAQVIMVVTPATAHRAVATLITPIVKDGQIIVLNPGRLGGALEFARTMRRYGLRSRPYLVEANTLIYAAEIRGPARVEILKVKNTNRVSALPAKYNPLIVPILQQMYTQFEPAQNVLETSFNNVGGVFHPAPALLNTVTIERAAAGDKNLRWYGNMVTQPIADMVMERIDKEKVAMAQALGLNAWTSLRWLRETYDAKGDTLFEALRYNHHTAGFSAPADFYAFNNILDEIPNNLVPMSSFGKLLGIPTPAIDSIVNLGCVMTGIDFWSEGRTVESLGLSGMTPQEIVHFVEQVDLEPVQMTMGPELVPQGVA